MSPKYLTGLLLAAAGVLFFLAGVVRRFDQPLWIILGVVLVAIGAAVLRSTPPAE